VDTAPYQLHYDAALGCTSEAEVRDEVAANVHQPAQGVGVTVSLSIKGAAGAYAGELVVVDRNGRRGRRELSAATCDEVAHALAFLAGLAIDLGGRVDDESPEPPPSAPPPPPPPPPAPPLPKPLVVSLTLAGGLRGGVGPSLQDALELGVGLGARRLAFEPTVRFGIGASAGRGSNRFGSVELLLATARVEGCPLWFGSASVGLRPCAGLEAGAAFAQSRVARDPKNPVDPWIAVDASLHLEWRPTRAFFVDLAAAVVVPLLRTTYYFELPERVLHETPAIASRLALGVGVRFP
jgi:hypothetical protein